MVKRIIPVTLSLIIIFAAACNTVISTPEPANSPVPSQALPGATSTTRPPGTATSAAEPSAEPGIATGTPAPGQTEIPAEFIPPRNEVARIYALQPEEVILTHYESAEWPTSCLGVEQPGMACLDVITSGYRLFFNTPQGTIVVHTNSDVSGYHILGPESGVEGQAMVGPACGGPVREGTECPDRPYVGSLWILDEHGATIAEITTDETGYFRAFLTPGDYTITLPQGTALPYLAPQAVSVTPGQFTQMQILLDSGIR